MVEPGTVIFHRIPDQAKHRIDPLGDTSELCI